MKFVNSISLAGDQIKLIKLKTRIFSQLYHATTNKNPRFPSTKSKQEKKHSCVESCSRKLTSQTGNTHSSSRFWLFMAASRTQNLAAARSVLSILRKGFKHGVRARRRRHAQIRRTCSALRPVPLVEISFVPRRDWWRGAARTCSGCVTNFSYSRRTKISSNQFGALNREPKVPLRDRESPRTLHVSTTLSYSQPFLGEKWLTPQTIVPFVECAGPYMCASTLKLEPQSPNPVSFLLASQVFTQREPRVEFLIPGQNTL